MIPFRERNPVPIGLVGLLVIGLILVLAFNAQSLPFIGGGTTYHADFSEAGGLKPDDDVRLAGVKVGKVTGISLDGAQVKVDFVVTDSDATFGSQTGASIRIQTLLGQKYLSLEPRGSDTMPADATIPLTRTVSAYDVVDAFSDLATTTERIDVGQLSQSLNTLATEFQNTPANVKAALSGLSRLSETVASRDEKLRDLLAAANNVSGTVASRNAVFEQLIKDADLLLQELDARREAIHTLFTNTSAFAQQVTALVRENRAQLQPALTQLDQVLAVLRKHDQDLSNTLQAMAPFYRVFASTLGTGRWFDVYVANLTSPLPNVGG